MHSQGQGAGAVYAASPLTGSLCTCNVHIQSTDWSTVKVQFTLHIHETCSLYSLNALSGAQCTLRVLCKCTHYCTMHLHCTLKYQSMVHCPWTVYNVSAFNGVQCNCIREYTYRGNYKCTHLCLLFSMYTVLGQTGAASARVDYPTFAVCAPV